LLEKALRCRLVGEGGDDSSGIYKKAMTMCNNEDLFTYEIHMHRTGPVWIADVIYKGAIVRRLYTVKSIFKKHCEHKAVTGIFDLEDGAVVRVTVDPENLERGPGTVERVDTIDSGQV